MTFIEDNLVIMLTGFAVMVSLQLLLVRRHVNNVADPIVYFAIMSAFSLGLGLYAMDSSAALARIVGYFAFFYCGFLFAMRGTRVAPQPLIMSADNNHLKRIVLFSGLIFLAANMLIWGTSGIILLSENPSVLKVTAYEGGFGFVRRINWGLGIFVLVASTYWYLWERSWAAVGWLALAMLVAASGGNKGAFLPVIFALGLYFLHPFYPSASNRKILPKKSLAYVLAIAVIPAAAVLIGEQENTSAALDAALVRLFYSGDILLYWGQADVRAYFSGLGVVRYLQESFGSILSILRLTDYTIPVGNQVVQFTLHSHVDFSKTVGPNLPFYVRGEMFFGPWFAPLHAAAVGWIIGKFRKGFVTYRGQNLLRYSLLATVVCLGMTIPTEEGLAVSQFVDFFLVYIFVHILSMPRRTSGTAERLVSNTKLAH